MSPDHSEPAPPLEPGDIALEASLSSLRLRAATPDFLDHLLAHLEWVASDEVATSSTDSPPMPLNASLLAFEHELRSLRPLDMDFPTGQRVLKALEHEIGALAPPTLHALPGSAPASFRKRWAPALPWATAAALVATSWIALPYLLRSSNSLVAQSDAGLIPYAPRSGGKGTVALVFPVKPSNEIFGTPGAQPQPISGTGLPTTVPRSFSIPQASPIYGLLDVVSVDLPAEYCRTLGIAQGVGVDRVGIGGPASTHGLERGDIILRINGAPVGTVDELSVMIKNSTPGSTVILHILRQGMPMDIPVRLGSAPSA